MRVIRFSHEYNKLHVVNSGSFVCRQATLLDVVPVKLENLSDKLIAFDTDNGAFELPKKGEYLMLIFQKSKFDILTTIRRSTPEKYDYYKKAIGETFKVEVKPC